MWALPRSARTACRCRAISAAARTATASASAQVVRRVNVAARQSASGASREQPLGRPQGRHVGGVAQQRLADALAQDASLAAGGAEDRPLALPAAGGPVARVQASG